MAGFRDAPARGLCTDCGVSRMADPSACGRACQFIAPNYEAAERRVHGISRAQCKKPDTVHFGPYQRIVRAAMKEPRDGAQWTGITTTLAQRLLEKGKVDAVLTMVPDEEDRWKPVPALITKPEDMARARGMRMGYAPLLALLEPAMAAGHKRLAVIGIPCQIHALRALEKELGLERLYVIGTPCSDNTTTQNFHQFLSLLSEEPDTISYLEFRADYQVELRFTDGREKLIPFLKLPISDLPSDFFPLTCRTCVDYTNALADITVGYMGGIHKGANNSPIGRVGQWLIIRNQRGEELLEALGDDVLIDEPGSGGKRQGPVAGFKANVERAAGGLPLRSMPDFLRPVVAWLMPRTGPWGMEFARARVEMKAVETVLHLRQSLPKRMKHMIPPHIWKLVAPYDVQPQEDEVPKMPEAAE
ncbi:MAG: Coenzyme F420 hydrogenase/dehydrogenase, beta subunit C-terminal domain [Pseudomonadota bacterium]